MAQLQTQLTKAKTKAEELKVKLTSAGNDEAAQLRKVPPKK